MELKLFVAAYDVISPFWQLLHSISVSVMLLSARTFVENTLVSESIELKIKNISVTMVGIVEETCYLKRRLHHW